jgi:hypothetical protein
MAIIENAKTKNRAKTFRGRSPATIPRPGRERQRSSPIGGVMVQGPFEVAGMIARRRPPPQAASDDG